MKSGNVRRRVWVLGMLMAASGCGSRPESRVGATADQGHEPEAGTTTVVTVPEAPGIEAVTALGQERGNGGTAVACMGEQQISLETLDVNEARRRGLVVDLGGSGQTFEAKLQIALGRLARLDPARAALYADRIAAFLQPGNFLDGIRLERIPDADVIVLDPGCELKQVVARRDPLFPGDRTFTVDNSLWQRLDTDNRVALALHEAIYEEAVKDFGHETAARTRLFVSFLVSSYLEQTNLQGYIALLQNGLAMPTYTLDTLRLDLRPLPTGAWDASEPRTWSPNGQVIEFYDGGAAIRLARMLAGQTYSIEGVGHQFEWIRGEERWDLWNSFVGFSRQGKLKLALFMSHDVGKHLIDSNGRAHPYMNWVTGAFRFLPVLFHDQGQIVQYVEVPAAPDDPTRGTTCDTYDVGGTRVSSVPFNGCGPMDPAHWFSRLR